MVSAHKMFSTPFSDQAVQNISSRLVVKNVDVDCKSNYSGRALLAMIVKDGNKSFGRTPEVVSSCCHRQVAVFLSNVVAAGLRSSWVMNNCVALA
jgi:hypothetical protein